MLNAHLQIKYKSNVSPHDRSDIRVFVAPSIPRMSEATCAKMPTPAIWRFDLTFADAILDRLVHNAHRIELAGESMRRTRGKQNQKA
jgi:hypothetical protein